MKQIERVSFLLAFRFFVIMLYTMSFLPYIFRTVICILRICRDGRGLFYVIFISHGLLSLRLTINSQPQETRGNLYSIVDIADFSVYLPQFMQEMLAKRVQPTQ